MRIADEGETAIDGVPGTAAPVQLTFLDAAGSKTGKLFPTGQTLDEGGMGVMAGLFKPAEKTTWPVSDATDSLYVRDLRHYLRIGAPAPVAVTSRPTAQSIP